MSSSPLEGSNRFNPDFFSEKFIDNRYYTDITRGLFTVRHLESKGRIPKNLNLTIIGLGSVAPFGISCTYEPYQIAAFLDQKAHGYRLSLVDVNKEFLDEFQTRRFIFTPANPELVFQSVDFQKAWKLYTDRTKQDPSIKVRAHPGLVRSDDREFNYYQQLSEGGTYLVAEIPKGIDQRLKSGQIQMYYSDITSFDAALPHHQDLVLCNYIMSMLNISDQQQAMTKLTETLNSGGELIITESFKNPLLKSIGGWLDQNFLTVHNLKIKSVENKTKDRFQRHVLFGKRS